MAEVGPVEEKQEVKEKVKPEEPIAETKPKLEGVHVEDIEEREGIIYLNGSDTPYTGKSYALYPNGQKWFERNYKNGKKDGIDVWWHLNRQKKDEANYKDGKRDGLQLEWWANGQKLQEENYNNDKKNGLQAMWYEDGQKKVEENWKDGKRDGLLVMWHKNGQKWFERNFKDGNEVEGSTKFWNNKGEPVNSIEEAIK